MREKWVAEWSGAFPNLCHGMWTLYKNMEKVDTQIPFNCYGDDDDDWSGAPAYTRREYLQWHFTKDYLEEFEPYIDGLECDEWCGEYSEWLSTIAPQEEWEDIYTAFKRKDWRYGECGGCI